jgi:hypothetical protein
VGVACERLAHRAPNPVVGVLVETLAPAQFSLDREPEIHRKAHVPSSDEPQHRVGGHLQNALPDFSDFGFQFAWAERLKCPAALPGVGTASEFKPVRDIAPASSHDQPVVPSRARPYRRSLRSIRRNPRSRIPCLFFGWQTRTGPLPTWAAFPGRGGATRSVTLVKQTAGMLHESLARILLVWFDRAYL